MLAKLGRHWRTGEPLPEALISSLVASRSANAGVMTLRQIAQSLLDLYLHHDLALTPAA